MLRMPNGAVRAEIRDGIAYGYDANGICVFQEPICKPRNAERKPKRKPSDIMRHSEVKKSVCFSVCMTYEKPGILVV